MTTDADRGPGGLTHLDRDGKPRMVEVGGKEITRREAEARGWIRMAPETFQALTEGRTPKGDPLAVAELAGVMAGKRTGELIPLCHVLPGASVEVELSMDGELPGVRARTVARFQGRTGVEMEALTALSLSLLTVYDMLKALDRGMEIGGIRLVRKSGGASGDWSQPDEGDAG